jgi:rubrerythrin
MQVSLKEVEMDILNIIEIIEMGIEKEKKRRDFYDTVSKKFKHKSLQDLFRRLSGWEETHVEKLNKIKSDLGETAMVEFNPGELKAYFRALVDDKLQHQISPDVFARQVKKEDDAIDFAISFEKDSVLFFAELAKYVSDIHHKEVVSKLVDEEKMHIVYLNELKVKSA